MDETVRDRRKENRSPLMNDFSNLQLAVYLLLVVLPLMAMNIRDMAEQ